MDENLQKLFSYAMAGVFASLAVGNLGMALYGENSPIPYVMGVVVFLIVIGLVVSNYLSVKNTQGP